MNDIVRKNFNHNGMFFSLENSTHTLNPFLINICRNPSPNFDSFSFEKDPNIIIPVSLTLTLISSPIPVQILNLILRINIQCNKICSFVFYEKENLRDLLNCALDQNIAIEIPTPLKDKSHISFLETIDLNSQWCKENDDTILNPSNVMYVFKLKVQLRLTIQNFTPNLLLRIDTP